MSFRDRISKWDIIGNAKLFFSISIIVILVGLIAMGVNFAKTGSPETGQNRYANISYHPTSLSSMHPYRQNHGQCLI